MNAYQAMKAYQKLPAEEQAKFDAEYRAVRPAEIEFLEILRKTCRTMHQARNRPEMAIPAAQWELRINERLEELDRHHQEELKLARTKEAVAA